MELLYYLFSAVVLLGCHCVASELEYDGKVNIKLEHSFDHTPNPVYFHRGDVYIKSLYSGAASTEEFELSSEQIKHLKNLAKKNGNYRLRATVKASDGKENFYYAFVKACSLIESHLNNVLAVNLDHNGNVIAVTLIVPNKCHGTETDDRFLVAFKTTVEIRHMETGPVPDTATYIQKLEREREAKERGEAKDNRSFLGKYWMYIVPVVIFMLLSSATNPDSGGAAQR